MKITVDKCGENLLIIIPAEFAQQLQLEQGDVLEGVVESGVMSLERAQTAHERAMEIADKMMDEYKATFEALAKT